MRDLFFIVTFFVCLSPFANAQITYTANDIVPEYNGPFHYGSNMGFYAPWSDKDLADVLAGNEELGIQGAGVRSLRPALYEYFLENWGYGIRVSTFEHYSDIGTSDHTAFIGYPNDAHEETAVFCSSTGNHSSLFRNMYTPIWDGGANGTPYNDENYAAAYVYQVVDTYKEFVKYWEVWNEPDQTNSNKAWKPASDPGSWWNVDPDPCDLKNIDAPIQHYIRLLRITYEVAKYVDPDCFVAVGGIGYPSFLHALLRNTDNPSGGTVSASYPLSGGAYFDCLSYHLYPQYSSLLSPYDASIGDFVPNRHSDPAAESIVDKKEGFEEVLQDFGYDGLIYPEKRWIITEINIARTQIGDFIGGDDAQKNFLIKGMVKAQVANIDQVYVYNPYDGQTPVTADNPIKMMGLYPKRVSEDKLAQVPNPGGVAFRTCSKLLFESRYNAAKTEDLDLPDNIDGGAFKMPDGRYTYVLWAKTQNDLDEDETASLSLAGTLGSEQLIRKEWDFTDTNDSTMQSAFKINLGATPSFFTELNPPLPISYSGDIEYFPSILLGTHPNPLFRQGRLFVKLEEEGPITLKAYNMSGHEVLSLMEGQHMDKGYHHFLFDRNDLPEGFYIWRLISGNRVESSKFVILD